MNRLCDLIRAARIFLRLGRFALRPMQARCYQVSLREIVLMPACAGGFQPLSQMLFGFVPGLLFSQDIRQPQMHQAESGIVGAGRMLRERQLVPADFLRLFQPAQKVLQSQRYQLQADRPAFGALIQSAQRVFSQRQVCQTKEGAGFVWRKAQVVGAQFGHLAAGAQTGQRQGRVGAGDQRQMDGGGLVLNEIVQHGVNLRVGDNVIVVQHQQKRGVQRRHVVEQIIEEARKRRRVWHIQQRLSLPAERMVYLLESCQEVAQEARRIITRFVERARQHGAFDFRFLTGERQSIRPPGLSCRSRPGRR